MEEVPMGVSSKAELKRRKKESKKAKSDGFESLGLYPEVYRGAKHKGYRAPTPIQHKMMPLILFGADVVAMARTGSGKTAAFLVPILQKFHLHIYQRLASGAIHPLILALKIGSHRRPPLRPLPISVHRSESVVGP